MAEKIIVDVALCEKIEALQYEVRARQDLITTYLDSRANISNARYEEYHKEYLNYFIQYEKAKKELVDKYVGPNKNSWNLDFNTRELTIQ